MSHMIVNEIAEMQLYLDEPARQARHDLQSCVRQMKHICGCTHEVDRDERARAEKHELSIDARILDEAIICLGLC